MISNVHYFLMASGGRAICKILFKIQLLFIGIICFQVKLIVFGNKFLTASEKQQGIVHTFARQIASSQALDANIHEH